MDCSHRRYKKLSHLFFCLISCYWLLAPPLSAQPLPGIFKSITGSPYDFSSKEVKDILRDRDGFLWIATTKGLFRYDGHDVRAYLENPLDSNSIGDNYVTCLEEDPDGSLWIGTGTIGLLRYDKRRERFIRYSGPAQDSGSLTNGKITDLLLDSRERLWAASNGGLGLVDHSEQRLIHIRNEEPGPVELKAEAISRLEEDEQGRIWIGCNGSGLKCFNPDTGELFQLRAASDPSEGFIDNRIRCMRLDLEGHLWFATYNDARLHQLDPTSLSIISHTLFPNDPTPHRVVDIWPEGDGSLWLAMPLMGVVHFSPGSGAVTRYRHDPLSAYSLPSNRVETLWLDSTRILWTGYQDRGVSQLLTRPGSFDILPVSFQQQEHTALPSPLAATEDSRGNLWIGTWRNGLYRYHLKTGTTTLFRHQTGNPRSLADDLVWDILEDQHDFIWIATHHGLQRFDPRQSSWMTFGAASGLEHEAIRSLWEDRTGRLWIGTFGGLHWLDAATDSIHLVDTFRGNYTFIVTEIYEDSRQNLWIAAHGRGLFRLDRKTNHWIHYQKKQHDPTALSSNIVRSIREDEQGRIWLGTEGGGLNLWIPGPVNSDPGTFRHWRSYNSSLPDENIYDISIGPQGRLWLSTDMGLFSFDPETEQVKFHFLPGNRNRLEMRTRNMDRGFLYAGNAQHVYQFNPSQMWQNEQQPPVAITDLEVNGRPLPVQGSFGDSLSRPSPLPQSILYTAVLELAHWQNDLTFTFSALSYIEPEYNRYRYQLEGYDDQWTETGASSRRVRYRKLSPGAYTFRVLAANNEGHWNTTGKAMTITIRSPWWWNRWSKTLYFFTFAVLLRAGWRYELKRRLAQAEARRFQELNDAKSRLYANITHEFRTPLTIISGLTEQVSRQVSGHLKDNLRIVKRNGKQLLILVNQMLELSRLESGQLHLELVQGDIISYLKYLLESFESYAAAKQIRMHFLTDLPEYTMDYDPTKVMNVLSNLVSNAVKFSGRGQDIYVSVDLADAVFPGEEYLRIKVKDLGVGIPKDQLPFVFDRFYQVDASTTRKEEGTGIGLTMTKELVQLMKGRITVNSEVGKGSEFTVVLPVTRQHESLTVQPAAPLLPDPVIPAAAHQQLPVGRSDAPLMLIVEDNQDLVRFLVDSFNPAYQLEVAYNGRQGVDKAVSLVPDIIITDVMMPEMDGFALCSALKQHQLTSHIPIIMLTARVDLPDKLTGFRKGADAYFAKPFVPEELEARVKSLLAQRIRLQSYFLSQIGTSGRTAAEASPAPEGTSIDDQFLKKVHRLIKLNLSDSDFGVEELSRALFVSSSSLFRKLKALTGLNPNQYIRSVRIAKAKTLLAETTLPISTIASEAGFSGPRYFSRQFKKETGMTPSAYRSAKRS